MRDRFSLHGRRALITGASSGIGAHLARVLAAAGADVALAARRISACDALAADIRKGSGKAVAVEMDVARASSIKVGIAHAADQLGGLDIVVNNAGVAVTASALDTSEADWDRVIDTNLKGAFLVAQAAAHHMKDHGGGAIINTASILGLRVTGQVSAYAASKAGLVQLTRALALEWARYNIRVNALCPGYVATEINRDFFASDASAALIKRIPMRRIAELSDLDGPLLLLASDAGKYLTGIEIPVDGGHLVSAL